MTAKRIAIVRHAPFPGDPVVDRQVALLVAFGYEVDVVCLRGSSAAPPPGVRVFRMPLGHQRRGALRYFAEYGLSVLMAATWVGFLHGRRRYPIVQINTMPDVLALAGLFPRLTGSRTLIVLQDPMPEVYRSKYNAEMEHPLVRALGRVEQAAIRLTDHAVTVGEAAKHAFVERGADPDRITVAPNVPDPAVFVKRSVEPSGEIVVSHGTIADRYGFDLLVDAVAMLAPERPALQLHIAGRGEGEAALRAHVESSGMASRVGFLGFRPVKEIVEIIAGASVGVVANRADPFTDLVLPMKLLEYVAVGVPVVAPRTAAIRAVFSDDAIGFFEPGDVVDLSRAVAECLNDRPAAAARAEVAKNIYEDRFGDEARTAYVRTVEWLREV